MKLVIEIDLDVLEGDKRGVITTVAEILPHIVNYPNSDLRVAEPLPANGRFAWLLMQGVDNEKYPNNHLVGTPTSIHVEVTDAPMPPFRMDESEVAETADITAFYEKKDAR